MKSLTPANRVFIVIASVGLLMLSATLAWGVVLDYQSRGIVTNGVSVAGQDLSGMTEAEAREAIERAVTEPTARPLTVTGDGHAWKLDPAGMVSVDVDGMLDEAYEPRRDATLARRLHSQLTGDPIPYEVEPLVAVDTSAVAEWVDDIAEEVDRKPKDATREVVGYGFQIKPERYGIRVSQKKAVEAIAEKLSAEAALAGEGDRQVKLPTKTRKPKIERSDFEQGIVVSISRCRVYLYDGEKLVRSYRCAPGTVSYPTPIGDFKVVRKLANAPWINPGSDWAKDMPRSIPPGPSNPMGVRKIGINYSGVYFHGIPPSEFSSIGSRASHGCMRMMPSDVLDLYGRVKVGTGVYIRP